jgi:hypothetical protein
MPWKKIGLRRQVKVDKTQFDNLLHKMMQAPPEPRKAIQREGKIGKIVPSLKTPLPAQESPSEPHKA